MSEQKKALFWVSLFLVVEATSFFVVAVKYGYLFAFFNSLMLLALLTVVPSVADEL